MLIEIYFFESKMYFDRILDLMGEYRHLTGTEMYRIVGQILKHLSETPASALQLAKKSNLNYKSVMKYVELIEFIQQADRVKIDIAPDKYLISKSTVKLP